MRITIGIVIFIMGKICCNGITKRIQHINNRKVVALLPNTPSFDSMLYHAREYELVEIRRNM